MGWVGTAARVPEDRPLNTPFAETLSAVLLVAVVAWAVVRPYGWPEAVPAVPSAGIAVATGAISLDHARAA